jgi:hypothetical protein
MKEFITVVVAFILVIGLAFYMHISNQKHNISVIENYKIQDLIIQKNVELRNELEELKNHVHAMDSIYHKN